MQPSNSNAIDRRTGITSVVAATVGNAFQFYDFFLYATASALIFGPLFFPTVNPALGTMAAFASYAVGFVSRPLGALVFGRIGDRFGRKVTMTWTLCLMGAGTFSIGVLPTYGQIGIAAPMLLAALRVLQGFAAGGEWGGGMLMATESAPSGRRGYFGAWSQAGVGVGFIISAGVFSLARLMSSSAFMAWGWRAPFLFSVVVVAVGVVIRARVPETADFRSARASPDHQPLRDVLKSHWRTVLVAGGILIAEMSGSLLATTFALAYGRSAGVAGDILLAGVILSLIADTVAMLFFGSMADRVGGFKVYMFGVVSFAVFIYPFFLMVGTGNVVTVIIAFILINGICHAAMIGPQPALLTELFPVSVRASGLALAQSVAVVFVGFVPLMASALYFSSRSLAPVVALTIALCSVSFFALMVASRSHREQLQQAMAGATSSFEELR
jgi:MFS family permease